ncbi:hypothetical protein B0J11DRAFT_518207 [Dendryphion nanum]|uniref:Inner centromere protein ARK-binding domain-containing protein n=1 Tax=Dendryphion nanum TaxID=256645 RepID=A0A9P9IYR8_9PLEO|nr:hypothetical protein B0J11DRAFT_518207 [Dendryphion nanum]
MAAARSKNPSIGSAQWFLDERHQSNDLVAEELEDFGFSVRNELEWLNEHMSEIFANNGQNQLDVFKTPGKLRGKTPRTARKKAAEPRQPLGAIFAANSQHRPSPAQQSLKNNLQKTTKARFQVAEDSENVAAIRSPVPSATPRPLFAKTLAAGKENRDSPYRALANEDEPIAQPELSLFPLPPQSSPHRSTQDTAPESQPDTVFTQEQTQSTQYTEITQATQSFRLSVHVSEDERRDTGESFVSAKEAFGSKNASKEDLRDDFDAVDSMDLGEDRPDVTQSDAHDTVIRHDASSIVDEDADLNHESASQIQRPRTSDIYSISAESQAALDTVIDRAEQIEPKNLGSYQVETHASLQDDEDHDNTIVHHEIEDDMDVDDDDDDEDNRSPSDNSSPVKPLVRKSSLTFASLPAREPLIAKKSMGNRVSRTSHVDQAKARTSHMGSRFTGGKSLGGSHQVQAVSSQDDQMDLDDERPELRREESETTKVHNHTYTKSIKDRINMLGQNNEPPKHVSQNIIAAHATQPQNVAPSLTTQLAQPAQPTYPSLPSEEVEKVDDEDDEDDWISPIRKAPAPVSRPPLNKSFSADPRPTPTMQTVLSKPISVSNPSLPIALESTTPAGSPTGRKYADGPLSASKAKFYSALRAAKGIIIGSSATSAQVKLDALSESTTRPKLHPTSSSDDVFGSPKRNDKVGTSIFSHLRSPSKESLKSTKSKFAAMPGSPVKEDSRRTRSSSERERVKEKEAKEKQRTDDKLKELREREQSKATAHYQKAKAAAKTPVPVPAQVTAQPTPSAALKTPVAQQQPSRPGTTRLNTGLRQTDPESADEMPPPPPPKSFLPTGTSQKLREPKRLVKAPSKETIPKVKPQELKVRLHGAMGRAPAPAPKPAPAAPSRLAPSVKAAPAPQKAATLATSKPLPPPKFAPTASKTAPRVGRPQAQPHSLKASEKPKPAPTQQRADLGAARPASRLQTVQDANRINVPPVNPAKPAKRPFQPESSEPLHRPAKRPSQQAKSNLMTPAHAQFAQGKIPFAEPVQPAPPTIQYPNGDDINLPDIMTDSEDEDSENEFEQPSWVNTPNLRDMLTQQQLVDPESIFGPIAPLNMEQVFPNKERHKRFRDRTSSAYWANDQVTEEERRKEREARERLVRDGAWTYNPSPRPGPSR